MFKVIIIGNGKTVIQNFHTLEAAFEAANYGVRVGKRVELCDMEVSRLMSIEALHPHSSGDRHEKL